MKIKVLNSKLDKDSTASATVKDVYVFTAEAATKVFRQSIPFVRVWAIYGNEARHVGSADDAIRFFNEKSELETENK